MDDLKQKIAEFAVQNLPLTGLVGIGSGTTVQALIKRLQPFSGHLQAVSSSDETTRCLQAMGIEVVDLNDVDRLPLYIDGADEVNAIGQLIKGGGGAHTREKILASAAQKFYCLIDESKCNQPFGTGPLPVEVLTMARSHVARTLVAMGGRPQYRAGFVTDNGHLILDVHGLDVSQPLRLEQQLNQIAGVVAHGLFAERGAEQVWIATSTGVRQQRHTT